MNSRKWSALLVEVDNKEAEVDFCATCVLKSTLAITPRVFWIESQ